MNNEQEKHAKIALWLGYWQNADNLCIWYKPNARGYKERQGFSGPPDFYNNPAHYERIKAKLRELGLRYKLDFRPDLDSDMRYGICIDKDGVHWECVGGSEGDVLVGSALSLIHRGL